ncbi:MAG: hypothetical protein WC223_14035 [Bacteroidales bacterium]
MKTLEYSAVVYKNRKNNAFIANCMMFNLIGYGKTEKDAISNLENSIKETLEEYNVIIKPMHKMILC